MIVSRAYADIPIVILAGGKSRRMGGFDKGMIHLEGVRLVDRLVAQISVELKNIVISGPHNYGLDLESISDLEEGPKGPVGGLHSMWAWLTANEPNIDAFFTVPIDCPKLPRDLFSRLYTMGGSCVARDDNGRHPTFALWRMADLREAWSKVELNNSISMHFLADMCEAQDLIWPGNLSFLNINTQPDIDKYLKSI